MTEWIQNRCLCWYARLRIIANWSLKLSGRTWKDLSIRSDTSEVSQFGVCFCFLLWGHTPTLKLCVFQCLLLGVILHFVSLPPSNSPHLPLTLVSPFLSFSWIILSEERKKKILQQLPEKVHGKLIFWGCSNLKMPLSNPYLSVSFAGYRILSCKLFSSEFLRPCSIIF